MHKTAHHMHECILHIYAYADTYTYDVTYMTRIDALSQYMYTHIHMQSSLIDTHLRAWKF